MCYNSKGKQSNLITLHGSTGTLRRLSQGKGQQLKNWKLAQIRETGQKENRLFEGLELQSMHRVAFFTDGRIFIKYFKRRMQVS